MEGLTFKAYKELFNMDVKCCDILRAWT